MKRFYRQVAVASEGAGWRVTLDGRAIRTAGGRAQIVPSRALAEAMAAEWADQGEEIDPARFALRDLADYALDVVAPDRAGAIAALLPYAETDTLCYRAEPGEALHTRQLEIWEPLLEAVERRYDVRFERISGIVHRPQPEATLARIAERLEAADDLTLAALRSLAGLAASLTIALLALEHFQGRWHTCRLGKCGKHKNPGHRPDSIGPENALEPGAELDSLWTAANLEEEWQADLWGREAEAEARRARRRADFLAAAHFAALAAAP